MRRKTLAVIVFTCVMSIGLMGCGKNDGQEADQDADGGAQVVEAKESVEVVRTEGFQLTVRDGFTGRAYKESKDLVAGSKPGGAIPADEINADMIVVNYAEGKSIPESSSYFKLEKLKRQETDIRQIAGDAAKLQNGADVDCSMEETTIGTIWPDIASDSLAGRTVYHVTSRIRDNDFMFEHFFFQTDAGVNMVIGVFYPRGDETARRDMMNQFLEVEFLK